MRSVRWLVVIASLSVWTSPVLAQVVFQHHHSFYGPGFYGPGFAPPGAFYGSPFSQVYVTYFSPPPIVIAPPPIVVVQAPQEAKDDEQFDVFLPRRQQPKENPAQVNKKEAPLPGVPASVFRPVSPLDRALAKRPAAPVAPLTNLKPARPKQPAPEAPEDKMALQMERGREAFAAKEYGQAERRFRQAALESPNQAMPFFLLAQTDFALAKYPEAVEAIQAGMHLQPDWPTAHFSSRELYGTDAADFAGHLGHLDEVLVRDPRDPVLLFLEAYELWFDGRPDEALTLFHRAAEVAPDKTFIGRFLQAGSAMPVARK